MKGIVVPHSNQYHLGACVSHLANTAGTVEAVAVAAGYHLCADCVQSFHGHLKSSQNVTPEQAFMVATSSAKEKHATKNGG